MKSKLIPLPLFFTVLCLVVFFVFQSAVFPASNENIDSSFATMNDKTPGCAIGVRQVEKWLYEGYHGMANIQYGVPISQQTSFDIGSISKQFTAALILILEHEGQLNRSDSLKKYWPEGPAWAENINLYHLIHHSSGMPDYLNDQRTSNAIIAQMINEQRILRNLFIGLPIPKTFIDNKIRSYFATLPSLQFKPGTNAIYSNTGYFFLGYIIEKITGKSIGDVAREKIFLPLKMEHTYYSDETDKSIPLSATGYQVIAFEKQDFYPKSSVIPTNGDGGVFTTIQDFAKWIDHLNHPVIAPKEVWENFLTLKDPKFGDAATLRDTKYRNGLFALNQANGNIVYYHRGQTLNGIQTEFFFDLKKRFSYMQFCNFDYRSHVKGFDRRWLYGEFGIQFD